MRRCFIKEFNCNLIIHACIQNRRTWFEAELGSRRRSEPGVFGSLSRSRLKKKTGAGAAWRKKSGAGAGAAKKLPAPQPCEKINPKEIVHTLVTLF